MGLIFDRRDVSGGQPACHAFIVGVSAYPYLEGGSLAMPTIRVQLGTQVPASAALSARTVSDWLMGAMLAKPLATLRLLLSPAENDVADPAIETATLDHFLRDAAEWQRDAGEHQDNMTFFYFAGHGFALSQGDHVMAMQDLGESIGPALRHSVKVNNIVDGMGPGMTTPDMARTQLFFIDANRRRPSELLSYPSLLPTAVFDPSSTSIDDRATLVIYAASPDSDAYAFPDGPTVFSRALMRSLDRGAAVSLSDRSWGVSVQSLCRVLPDEVATLASQANASQRVVIEGSLRDALIVHLDQPPMVDFAIQLEPADAAVTAQATLSNDEGAVVAEWDARVPSATQQVPAGLYVLDVRGQLMDGNTIDIRRVVNAVGPVVDFVFNLGLSVHD
jgi:hypothetical protein